MDFAFLRDQPRVPLEKTAAGGKDRNDKTLPGISWKFQWNPPELFGADVSRGYFKDGVERRPVIEHFTRDGKPACLADNPVVTKKDIKLKRRSSRRGCQNQNPKRTKSGQTARP